MDSSFEFPDASCKFISVVKTQHRNQTNAIIQEYIAFQVEIRSFLDNSKLIPVDTPKIESTFLANRNHVRLTLRSYLHSARIRIRRLTRRARALYEERQKLLNFFRERTKTKQKKTSSSKTVYTVAICSNFLLILSYLLWNQFPGFYNTMLLFLAFYYSFQC